MTARTDGVPAGRPRVPVASAVVVLAALVVGAGALATSAVLGSGVVRLLIALVLLAGGWWIVRPARDRCHPLTLALGSPVLRGVGTAYVVLGAYLAGLALLTVSISDGAVGPSPTVMIAMVYGLPALALLAVATTGMRAWTAGAGAVLPMIAVSLLFNAGVSTAVVAVAMLAVGVVLAAFVVRAPGGVAWGDLASAAAAMATSFAFGVGTSPFGTLAATQLAGTPGTAPAEALSPAALAAVLFGALLVAAILLLVAVARHDLAGGVLVGSIVATPPVLLSTWLPPDARWPAEALIALAGVPALAALTAMTAIRVPRFRDALVAALPAPPPPEPSDAVGERPASDLTHAEPPDRADPVGPRPADVQPPGRVDVERLDRTGPTDTAPPDQSGAEQPDPTHTEPATAGIRRPSAAIATAAAAVVVAAAAVAFVILAVPVFGWGPGAQGAIGLVVLVGVGALGYWLPATPGAAGAVVALLGLGLASPWARLLTGASAAERIIAGVLDLGAAAVLAWFLTRRHPRAGVFAAAAYPLAGSMAAFLGSLLLDPDHLATGGPPFGNDLAPAAIVALPLLLLGLAAAAAMLRGHLAVGQAVGAVALAAAGFVPLKVLVGEFSGGGLDGFVLRFALNPLTPTDWLQTSAAFAEVTGAALVAVLVLALLALGLATSLAARPSAPLAGAVALLLLAAVQSALLTVLSSSSPEDAALLGQVWGGLAALTAVVAVVTAVTAARRT